MAAQPDVFLYLGHGEDICSDDNRPIIESVPAGSTVLQSSTCGLITFPLVTNLVESFKNPDNHAFLSNPFGKTEELHTITMDARVPDLKIRSAGTPLVKSRITTLLFFPETNNFQQSGIYKMSDMTDVVEGVSFFVDFKTTKYVTIPQILSLFSGSIQPNWEEIRDHLTSDEAVEKLSNPNKGLTREECLNFIGASSDPFFHIFQVDFTDYVARHPGIHYHFFCRYVRDNCLFGAAAQRQASGTNNAFHGLKYIEQVGNLKKYKWNTAFENQLRTATVEEVKEIFHRILSNQEGFDFSCDSKKNPVYLVKRIMEMRKGDPGEFKDLMIEAIDKCRDSEYIKTLTPLLSTQAMLLAIQKPLGAVTELIADTVIESIRQHKRYFRLKQIKTKKRRPRKRNCTRRC